jgi:hypothetical protein
MKTLLTLIEGITVGAVGLLIILAMVLTVESIKRKRN